MKIASAFSFLALASLLICVVFATCSNAPSEPVKPEVFDSVKVTTYTYALIDEDTLKVDLYQNSDERLPLVLFVHGGGFMGGSYDHPFIRQFCDSLAQTGVHVASMSYRLTLRGESFDCEQSIANKLRAFGECTNDIRRATSFCLGHMDEFNFDGRILLCGSSAGAEAALYHFYSAEDDLLGITDPVDSGFQYTALISMAGAVCDTATMTNSKALPTLMFHGACDPLVPICSNIHHYCPAEAPGALMLHGSVSMAARLDHLQVPHWTVIECGGDHSIANRAMTDHFQILSEFVRTSFSDDELTSRLEIIDNGRCEEVFCPVCD